EKGIQDIPETSLPTPPTIPPTIPTAPASVPPPVPAAVSNRIWHIVKDGTSSPYPEFQLKGKITPDTLAWTEGQADWQPASEVLPQLFA
ncbi:MAG: DUF4339 domain-containing protein, partial [Planktothrix sp.]